MTLNVGEPVLAERIVLHDRLDLVAAGAERQNDAAVARNLAPGHQESAFGVVLLQERHVRAHVGVDLGEIGLIDELDDEHRRLILGAQLSL